MNYIINPIIANGCIAIAIFFFRKNNVTISQALSGLLLNLVFKDKPKITEIFTKAGIVLLVLGLVIAFVHVATFLDK